MADEQTTDVTNSAEATPTAETVTPDQSSSATTIDPLDGGTLLTDADEKPGTQEEEGGGEGEKPPVDPASFIGAPEGDYEIDGLPEGLVLDQEALAAAAPVFKELNLSNAGASRVAQVYAEKVLPGIIDKVTNEFTGNVVAVRQQWDSETRAAISGGKDAEGNVVAADAIYGGKPFDAVTATAAKSIDRFGGEDFRAFLKDTGLGNHPAMMRFAYQAGSLISEDTDFERSGHVPNTPKSREEKYYPPAQT